jgi:polysaccharide biosynthesis/export protein
MWRRVVAIAALVAACVFGFAQNPVSPPSSSTSQQGSTASTTPSSEPLIGPGDLIEMRVFNAPDMTQELRINSDGEALLPLLGPVEIGGLTAAQAQQLIETKLREGGFIRNPHVTLFTKEYASQGISVLGEVSKPGVYPVVGQRRLYDLLSVAGGTTARAGKNVTIARRAEPDKPINVQISTDPSKSMESNVEVFPGDTVVVSRAGVIYVVGSVAKPSGFTMENDDRITVLEAIALAGGTSPTAALNGAKIIRRGDKGVQEIATPLKPLLAAKAQDTALLSGDILFVPDSKAKSAARRSLESIVQITTGLAIYRR